MAAYTRVNLIDDVVDMAPRFGMEGFESRFAKRDLQTEKTGMTFFRLAPGTRTPFGHRHRDQEELYVLVEGSARIKVDDDVLDLRRWDAVRVSPEAWRALESGPEGAVVLAFGGPTAADAPQDAETAPGWWS